MLNIQESKVINETMQCSELTIGEGVVLSAPEKKCLSLIVDGVNIQAKPGKYSGNIVLAVTEDIGRKALMGNARPFTAAIAGKAGKILPEKSAIAMVKGGTVADGEISGVSIKSECSVVSGIDLVDGRWNVDDADISLKGYGDCNGKGAGLYIGGDAEVAVNNLNLENKGVSRSGMIVDGTAKVVVKNATIRTFDGTAEEMTVAKDDVGGMLGVPWQLGLSGNTRATTLLSAGTVEFIDCTVESQGWGALSVDGVMSSDSFEQYTAHLTAKNCKVRITGESGYGAFSIGPCLDVFEDTEFDVADYGLIQANETASATYDRCKVASGRFGVMSYNNQCGKLEIRDSSFNTKNATFLVKGCYPQITVERSELKSEDGIILQLMDLDDPCFGTQSTDFDSSIPEKDPEHDTTKVNLRNFKLFGRVDVGEKPTDAQATFKDMTLVGNFYNGTTNSAGITYFDMSAIPDGPMDGELPGDFTPPGGPASGPDVPGGFTPPAGMGVPGDFVPPAGMGVPGDFVPPAGMGAPGGFTPPAGMGAPGGFAPPAGMGAPGDFVSPAGMGAPGGFTPPAGMGAPDGAPEVPSGPPDFTPTYSTNVPTNLAVHFEATDYTGCISATTTKHAVKECSEANYRHMGVVTNTISPVVNNGVIVSLDGKSSWTVTGNGYLSALHLAPGAKVQGADGKTVVLVVNGVETPIVAGDYTGELEICLR